MELTDFDPAAYLDTPEAQAEFLTAALEHGDVGHIAHALGIVARAHGMSRLSRETRLPRGTLYNALSAEGNPTTSTLLGVLAACGLKLVAEPASEKAA